MTSIIKVDQIQNAAGTNTLNLGSGNSSLAGSLDLSNGGVYLGGTGSANYLDDYEIGVWSPHIYDNGTQVSDHTNQGLYVKSGDMVHITTRLYGGSSFTTNVYPYINLPFVPASGNAIQATSAASYTYAAGGATSILLLDGNSVLRFSTSVTNPFASVMTSGASFSGSSKRFYFSLTYRI